MVRSALRVEEGAGRRLIEVERLRAVHGDPAIFIVAGLLFLAAVESSTIPPVALSWMASSISR